MIYLQMGILILEIGLCILLNNLLKNKSNKKNTIRHLDNDQEIHLNNITLIGRKDYTNKNQKKTKDYHLTNKTYNIVLDHQPQGARENIKNNVDLNSVVTPTTFKCFHYLSLTTYNPTLRTITERKHSNLHKNH